ncbi:MAG: hypothetical protein QG567_509, partial [Campylobacterota bacterium]|nr:hypothetical protein [Campylobacterota bacterium]
MNKFLYILIFMLGSSYLYAVNTPKLVWPPPPDEAKIEYVSSVRDSKDLGIKKSFFSRAVNFLFGEDEIPLSAPFGMHSDKERVYVTDIVHKELYVFDKKENEILTIEGSKKEKFLYPIDVVTDSTGNIYVSDSVRVKIYVFKKNGNFSHTIAPKVLQRPVGIAISPDDKKLYIVDSVS